MSGSKQPSLINPFELLGFNSKKHNISLKELKRNYYNLALMCHPDKGGNKDDMIMLQNAYEYVKKQVELSQEKSHDYDETVDQFETFMKKQESDPPPFSQVYEEAHIWLQEFNQKFQDNRNCDNDDQDELKSAYDPNDPNEDGYGSFMDRSEYDGDTKIQSTKYSQNFKEFNKPVKHQFDWDLMDTDSSQFTGVMDYNSFFELKKKNIDDFTRKTEKLGMSDYRMAFTPANIKNTKSVKIEKPRSTEVENKFEKLKTERYLLDSELDDRVIDKSFVMLDEETKSIPIDYQPRNQHQKRRGWF
jgi:curved DNA-binding protein CbpA